MKQTWVNNLSEDEAVVIRQEYIAAALLRRRLTALLTDKIDTNRSTSRNKSEYEKPAWPYLQADAMGYERAVVEVISLLSDKK
jgi:hypothetical protein